MKEVEILKIKVFGGIDEKLEFLVVEEINNDGLVDVRFRWRIC